MGAADGMGTADGRGIASRFEEIAGRIPSVVVICGHYGVGKTSLSVSLAIDAVANGYDVALSDLDVVNPYFRSSDCKAVLDEAGVRLIEPVYARSNVDGPSITNETAGAVEWARAKGEDFGKPRLLIIDAGGDDSGATVLGRFSDGIKAGSYGMFYVVNRHRGFDHTPEEAVGFLREIEKASHLRGTGIVGNTHLKADTDSDTIMAGIPFAQKAARIADLPLEFITMPQQVLSDIADRECDRIRQMLGDTPLYAMGIYVRAPWE